MGEFDRQQAPAKSSGVSAEDLVRAPDLGTVSVARSHDSSPHALVGDQWIDNGAVCDRNQASTPGCFLSDPQRLRLIFEIKTSVVVASTNYKQALLELRVDELVKKEEDLSWVLSLALDLVGAHLVVSIGRALKTLTSSGASKLARLGLEAARRGEYDENSWTSRAEQALEMVSNTRLDQLTKLGGDKAKAKTASRLSDELHLAEQTAKEANLSYLDHLRDGCDAAFKAFERQAIGSADDAELVLLWKGMDSDHHTPGAYKRELAEKLARFRDSGVNDIGSKDDFSREWRVPVQRDTRVVFVQNINGMKTLWYQSQETFNVGPRRDLDPKQLDRPVPEEFRDVAVARSEQLWGPTETIDDGYVSYLKDHGVDVAKAYQQVRGTHQPTRLPAGSVFANQPPAPLTVSARGGVPHDSIFAPATKPHDDIGHSASRDMSGFTSKVLP